MSSPTDRPGQAQPSGVSAVVVLEQVGVLATRYSPIPSALAPDELLVAVHAVGICGSDLAAYRGTHPYKRPPAVLGHEVCGEVVRVGSGVRGVLVGDRVCTAAFAGCGSCDQCDRGRENRCPSRHNLSHDGWAGGLAEHLVLRERMTHLVPAWVPDRVGALLEPLAIARHVLSRLTVLPDPLVVIGAGGIGLSVVSMAKALGVEQVTAVDTDPETAEISGNMGACHLTAGEGSLGALCANAVIVTTSDPEAINAAIDVVSPGGEIVVVAYHDLDVPVDMAGLMSKEARLSTSLLATSSDFQHVVELVSSGLVDPSPMISHTMPLEQAAEAFRVLDHRTERVCKVVLVTSRADAA